MADEKKGKKKHTHAVTTIAAKDGTYVHHHHMKDHPDDQHATVHENAATSQSPEEAGQHVEDTMAQNEPMAPPQAAPEAGAAPDAGAAAPGAGAGV